MPRKLSRRTFLAATDSWAAALVSAVAAANFGQVLLLDLAHVILFLPMALVLVLRPQGLFGRV